MRYAPFVVLLAVLVLFEGGIFSVAHRLSSSWERSASAALTANVLEQKLSVARAAKETRAATMLFVGDVMLARGIAYQIKKHNDARYPFLLLADELQSADILFGNLENPISSHGAIQGSIYSFRADPAVLHALTFAGFDVMSLANNHIWDYGAEALRDTADLLLQNGIAPIGAGEDATAANRPFYAEIGTTRAAFLAYTTLYPESLTATEREAGVSLFEKERVAQTIQAIKSSGYASLVVVSFHWGEEYQTNANTSQREIAHALVDAGADLVIGHHPHVVQEVEQYRHGWIAYSLGNFVFDQNFDEGTREGLMLKVRVEQKAIASVEPLRISFTPSFQPQLP